MLIGNFGIAPRSHRPKKGKSLIGSKINDTKATEFQVSDDRNFRRAITALGFKRPGVGWGEGKMDNVSFNIFA